MCTAILLISSALKWHDGLPYQNTICAAKTTVILRGIALLLAMLLHSIGYNLGFHYALAAVLVIAAVVSTVRFLYRKAVGKASVCPHHLEGGRNGGIAFIASLPAIIFPEYRPLPTTGECRL